MDKYAELRAALAAGPTPGPWTVRYDYVVQATSFDGGRLVPVAQPYGVNSDGTDLFANARMIAACHPEAIRSLLAERDALREVAQAALAYDSAIQSCANNPDAMSSFCTAEGDDLDSLYADWISKARAALAQDQGGSDGQA